MGLVDRAVAIAQALRRFPADVGALVARAIREERFYVFPHPDLTATRVRARLTVTRNGDHDRPLRLDGDELTALSVRIDGKDAAWEMDGPDLVVPIAGNEAVVETEVELNPTANTQLMGLYASNGMLCTQCEAEGFRRITFFPDRPDVLSRYTVRMDADAAQFPILLTNGNAVATGKDGDRHWAEWEDPFPKPSYLFALVAGDLVANRDSFTTMSGRKVDLGIWVREGDVPRTAHAMASLRLSIAWAVRGRSLSRTQMARSTFRPDMVVKLSRLGFRSAATSANR
jgi:aminopeptidase N